MMLDRWILNLNTLFILAIAFWSFAAWRELWIYRHIKDTFAIITKYLNAPNTFDLKTIPECLIARGVYKNRNLACRICDIIPTRLFFYRMEIHCHVEPGSKTPGTPKGNAGVSYRTTALSVIKKYSLVERISEQEILDILEEITRAAELVESKT